MVRVRRVGVTTAILAILATPPVWAKDEKVSIEIPAQSLSSALETLASQSHSQLLYSADLVRDLKSEAVKGSFTAEEALRKILHGSGLDLRKTADATFTIIKVGQTTVFDPVIITAKRDKPYAPSTATVGGKTPTSIREIPNSVSVITREQMDDQNMTDLSHAMNWATGIDTRPNDGTQSQYYSRGYAMNVLYDGVPAYSSLSGYQQLDLAMYERIEVMRGPSGVFQGSGDFGGSVNMVRKHAKDKFSAEATTSVGSWNNLRGMVDVTGPLIESKTLRGRLVFADNDRDYFYDHAHTKKWMLYGILDYEPNPDWTFSYSATLQEDRSTPFYGLPVYSNLSPIAFNRSANPMAEWSNMAWQTHEEQVQGEHKLGNNWNAKVTGSWREQTLGWKDGYPGSVNAANDTATYTIRDRFYRYERLAGDAFITGPFTLFGREHTALFGANIESFDSNGTYETAKTVAGVNIFNLPSTVTSEPSLQHTRGSMTHTVQYGEYGKLSFRVLDPLLLIVGGRVSTFDSKSRSMTSSAWANTWSQGAKAVNEFTPYGGAVLDVTKQTSIYASYADIFAPQTSLTADGSVLPPRTGWQTEMGVKNEYMDGALRSTVAVFLMRDVNRAVSDPNNTGYSIAAGEVESRGWEAELAGSPIPELKMTAGYTYLTTQYVNDPNNQGSTFSTWEPRHSLKAWGVYTFPEGAALDGFSVGSGIIAKSHTWGTSHNLNQKAYTVVDGQIGYKFSDNLSSTLTVNNIFDTIYWSKILSTTNNFYGEPRSVTFSIRAAM
ncbi:TonB-dependent siderophore receptor [Paramagnetospirillum kuznetsovii]|uniref:TonB-dependent siderophore receptor n=1 Tax=Paramagnetospirillum kuznetsovii TaxID=2053833 RepID=A0A364NT98_9PROT|nr:TonB-dependent siderophore receptor [Paramagnetospirillum kuznetsovii]RAU20319.1 TonB-dependent siderophore receptor [Paramagnetospirillum kuznetsovii]